MKNNIGAYIQAHRPNIQKDRRDHRNERFGANSSSGQKSGGSRLKTASK